MQTATILLVEDDTSFSSLVVRALARARPAWSVRACSSATSAVAEARAGAFDLAVVDLGLPDQSGIELIDRLAALPTPLRSAAFTIFDDHTRVFDAVRAGAVGYLLKEEPLARVVEQLDECLDGGMPVSSRIARYLFERCRDDAPDAAAEITKRERDVLDGLARGLTYAETAALLGLGLGTVQTHIKNIYRKLDVSTKEDALALAGGRRTR